MNRQRKPQILVIGPLPPPLAGTSVSFGLFCDYVKDHADLLHIEVINSAPKSVGQRSLLNIDNLITATRILCQYVRHIRKSDQVLLFGNDQFLLSLMPVCLLVAKLAGKPFYVRTFGGSLDTYYLGLSSSVRRCFRWVLEHTDGLIVQTDALREFFSRFLGDRVHHVPGYRLAENQRHDSNPPRRTTDALRLVYVGHIREEKGVFDLLESLMALNEDERSFIECDLYGPVYDDVSNRFEREIALNPVAKYKGVLQSNDVVATIAAYDVFIFPSYYKGEGHPGVLIEAMMSGLPVIATNFSAIPELIKHRDNGLLVAPNNPEELLGAIRILRNDAELLAIMSNRSRQSGKQYLSTRVIPQILLPLGIQLANEGHQ